MKLEFREIKINKVQQPAYCLSPLNNLKNYIDWEVKKVYYLTKTKLGSKTTSHCHKEEKELFIMLSGTCVAVIDQGNGLEEFNLEGPESAIYVGNYVWHHFKDFSQDAVLLAISSSTYKPDRSDYIENYDEYLKIIESIK